jgi:hypothetical protein
MLADATDTLLDRLGTMIGHVALLEDHALAVTASAMSGSLTFPGLEAVVGRLAATTDR